MPDVETAAALYRMSQLGTMCVCVCVCVCVCLPRQWSGLLCMEPPHQVCMEYAYGATASWMCTTYRSSERLLSTEHLQVRVAAR